MSLPNALNPDSTILQQIDGQLDKLFAAVVHKAGGGKPIKITADDLQALAAQFNGHPMLFTHGMSDGIEFSVVGLEEAKRLVEHDRAMREASMRTAQ